jgi:hypothetical protein
MGYAVDMGGLNRTPPPKSGIITSPTDGEELPEGPKGSRYSKEEISGMSEKERQWLRSHEFLIDWVDCDADWYQSVGTSLGESSEIEDDLTKTFHQMHMDPKGEKKGPAKDKDVKPDLSSDRIKIPTLYYERDVSKILKSWPNEDLPKFKGTIDKDAKDWLGTMVVLLTDCQAHPSFWQVVSGQRLSGKAFKDHRADNDLPSRLGRVLRLAGRALSVGVDPGGYHGQAETPDARSKKDLSGVL